MNQYSPTKLKEFLEQNKYELLDRATGLPNEVFDLLDNIKFLAQDSKKHSDMVNEMQVSLQKQRKWQNLTIITLTGIIMMLLINKL
jgi:hypothetical protein